MTSSVGAIEGDVSTFQVSEEDSSIHWKEREDGITIQKTGETARPIIENLSLESSGLLQEKKVSRGPVPSYEESLENFAANMTPEERQIFEEEAMKLQAMFDRKALFTPGEANFLTELLKIVAVYLAHQDRMNENSRKQVEALKREYQVSMATQGDLLKKMGNAGLTVAFVGLCVFLGQFAFGANQGVQEVFKFASNNLTQSIGGVVNAPMQAKNKGEEGKSSLALNQLQMEQTKKQSESSSKQEVTNVVEKAESEQLSAARPG